MIADCQGWKVTSVLLTRTLFGFHVTVPEGFFSGGEGFSPGRALPAADLAGAASPGWRGRTPATFDCSEVLGVDAAKLTRVLPTIIRFMILTLGFRSAVGVLKGDEANEEVSPSLGKKTNAE